MIFYADQSIECVPKYLEAISRNDIIKTLIVGSPEATILQERVGFFGEHPYNLVVLSIGKAYSEQFIVFPTINPTDPKNLERFNSYMEMGGKGLKLYNGHSFFHELPLDYEGMSPIYQFYEKNRVPTQLNSSSNIPKGYLKQPFFRRLVIWMNHVLAI